MFGKQRKKRAVEEVNSSSMADIAFLLLIFFLVSTTIVNEKAVKIILPPAKNDQPPKDLPERNVFKVLLNSKNLILVEDEIMEVGQIKEAAKEFIDNKNRKNLPTLSVSPKDAVISFKTDRGTTHGNYIAVLDQLKAAYNELRAEYLGIPVKDYLKLDKDDPTDNEKLDEANKAYPMNLSEAEPTNFEEY